MLNPLFVKYSRSLVFSFTLCALSAQASAYYSGADLLVDCQSSLASGRANFCLGFLTAAIQNIQELEHVDPATAASACDASDIETESVVRLFVSWARVHRDLLIGPAVISLRIALIDSALAGVGITLCKPSGR